MGVPMSSGLLLFRTIILDAEALRGGTWCHPENGDLGGLLMTAKEGKTRMFDIPAA